MFHGQQQAILTCPIIFQNSTLQKKLNQLYMHMSKLR